MNEPLVQSLHERGFEIAIETNGTKLPPAGIDWICVSPKANADLVLKSGDELKLIYPQAGAEPARYESLDLRISFCSRWTAPARQRNTELAVRYCLAHPQWRLERADAKNDRHQVTDGNGRCITDESGSISGGRGSRRA